MASNKWKICFYILLIIFLIMSFMLCVCCSFYLKTVKVVHRFTKTHTAVSIDRNAKQKFKYILADRNNKPLNDDIYTSIQTRKDRFIVTLENKRQGVVDKNGKYIIPPDYLKIKFDSKPKVYVAEELIYSDKGIKPEVKEQLKLFDENGNFIINTDEKTYSVIKEDLLKKGASNAK